MRYQARKNATVVKRGSPAIAASFVLCTCASATPYWIAYEGNDFPENEGWTRISSDGGAVRSIENGNLILDSRQSVAIVDFYSMERAVDPDPGEFFVMQWGLRVREVSAREDPTVVVFSDDHRAMGFEFGDGYLINTFQPEQRAFIEPDERHDFSLTSSDMLSYQLWVDGLLTLEGDFFGVFNASRVSWGDGVQGSSSLAYWDYFRFGVVPEPATTTIGTVGVLCCRRPRQ